MKICSVPSNSETSIFLAEIKRNVIQDSAVPLCHSTVLFFLPEMPPASCQTGKLLDILHQPVEILLFLQSLPEFSKQSKWFCSAYSLDKIHTHTHTHTHTPNSYTYICVHDKSLWLCPTFCNCMDCSPPGSSIHGILQATHGVGCHALLQGIFQTQAWNLHLLCIDRQVLYHQLHLESPTGTYICVCVCVCVCVLGICLLFQNALTL